MEACFIKRHNDSKDIISTPGDLPLNVLMMETFFSPIDGNILLECQPEAVSFRSVLPSNTAGCQRERPTVYKVQK